MNVSIDRNSIVAPEVSHVFDLFGKHGSKIVVYGGVLRNFAAFGTSVGTSDLDIRIDVAEWNKLPRKVRLQFFIHPPHRRFLKYPRRAAKGKKGWIRSLKQSLVLRSKPELTAQIGIPLEVAVSGNLADPYALARDGDLGFCQVAYDGKWFYATPAFERDIAERTMTLVRCNNHMDLRRINHRWRKFETGLYRDWKRIIPDEFLHFYEL
jgi:hypothetical protein